MRSFSEWVIEEHPEYELQEWPAWMRKIGRGLKKAAPAAALGATLLSPTMLRDPTPVDYDVSADYYSATDDKAHQQDAEDLERIKRGEKIPDRDVGKPIQISSQDEIENEEMPRGSRNWLAASGEESGTRAIWEKGFGGNKKDRTIGRGWHTFGFDDHEQARRAAINNALQQVRGGAAATATNIPFDKLTHDDAKNLRVRRVGEWTRLG